jgi:hypothetical protein
MRLSIAVIALNIRSLIIVSLILTKRHLGAAMRTLFLIAATAFSLAGATAIAADAPTSTIDPSCEKLRLAEADLKSCKDQMAVATSDTDRIAIQKRFQKGPVTPGVEHTTGTSTDIRTGTLPDQKRDAPCAL